MKTTQELRCELAAERDRLSRLRVRGMHIYLDAAEARVAVLESELATRADEDPFSHIPGIA